MASASVCSLMSNSIHPHPYFVKGWQSFLVHISPFPSLAAITNVRSSYTIFHSVGPIMEPCGTTRRCYLQLRFPLQLHFPGIQSNVRGDSEGCQKVGPKTNKNLAKSCKVMTGSFNTNEYEELCRGFKVRKAMGIDVIPVEALLEEDKGN
ncbi:hypothetical protein QE152_g19489 [Popillia japonica]|uniref:Uncharacterized protein n=1 Tax=Popillia japonica TaxID=7064 RepID=A0AAW1KT43_POPJA